MVLHMSAGEGATTNNIYHQRRRSVHFGETKLWKYLAHCKLSVCVLSYCWMLISNEMSTQLNTHL